MFNILICFKSCTAYKGYGAKGPVATCSEYFGLPLTKWKFVLEADFGPCEIYTLFKVKNNGKHTIVHDTPLASKLLDIEEGGLDIAFQ